MTLQTQKTMATTDQPSSSFSCLTKTHYVSDHDLAQEEEGFIDMEVSSSPPQAREFEFQMNSFSHHRDSITVSPADELFCNGKLLPLHLKSFFNKSGCSDDSCSKEAEESVLNRYMKMGKRNNPFGQIGADRFRISDTLVKGIDREMITADEAVSVQRRSFSGAIKWHSAPKCSSSSTTSSTSSSSSSFSFTSANGYYDLNLLKRSNSASSELERSIQGAIAHLRNC